jgi:ubiquinone/menaquinone biosynthesis C-methylase UbiE
MKNNKTSWGNVAGWYDELLSSDDNTFQGKVILPNLIRIIEPKKDMTIIDVACGQGYFSHAFANDGATVIGSDISKELIKLAQNRKPEAGAKIEFHVAPSDKLDFIKEGQADVAVIVLAIQNIKDINSTFTECARALKSGGRLILVLNHPAFRIPQRSSWEWAKELLFRRIDAYNSEDSFKIDMTPGEKDERKKIHTLSFHRPLQVYFKSLRKAGFVVSGLEEWISHKKSQTGPRSAEEDRMRKEIPMFICLECRKV